MGTYTQTVLELSMLNAALACLLSLGAGMIVLWDKVDEGLLTKVGLCVFSLSQFAIAVMLADGSIDGDATGLLRAHTCSRLGLLAVGLGVLWRHSVARKKMCVFFAERQQKRHI